MGAVLQQQNQAPVAAPAAGSMLSQVAQACLLLLSGTADAAQLDTLALLT